tara:strand:- start:122 stop:550 length:429 start_codon:yes stop_codon:yes gene_type:complete
MDTISKSQRSYNMSRIRSRNTKPEIIVRQKLFSKGIRYRIHVKDLPGKPDIVIKKYKVVIEIKGCFWHKHEGCRYSSTPKSNTKYWINKIKKNVERDVINLKKLEEKKFKVFLLWECEIKNTDILNEKLNQISKYIKTQKIK